MKDDPSSVEPTKFSGPTRSHHLVRPAETKSKVHHEPGFDRLKAFLFVEEAKEAIQLSQYLQKAFGLSAQSSSITMYCGKTRDYWRNALAEATQDCHIMAFASAVEQKPVTFLWYLSVRDCSEPEWGCALRSVLDVGLRSEDRIVLVFDNHGAVTMAHRKSILCKDEFDTFPRRLLVQRPVSVAPTSPCYIHPDHFALAFMYSLGQLRHTVGYLASYFKFVLARNKDDAGNFAPCWLFHETEYRKPLGYFLFPPVEARAAEPTSSEGGRNPV